MANQSISEEQNNQKTEYTYDVGGNIKEKHIISPDKDETISYGYDFQWKDLLVAYNGSTISRDDLGNVTNDGIWNYQWQSGRQLESMENGTTNISYKYNIDGLRTYKSVANAPDDITEYNYIWSNKLLVGMEVTDSIGAKNTLRFLYEAGSSIGFILNETEPYLYEKNLSGDVCGIVDKNGATVASYEYDAWGNELTASGDNTLLFLNPFTYRGYQFDRETGLYYLQSRYFNPQWCQFINADTNLDTQTSIIGTNIFAYCDNNPVMKTDATGKNPNQQLFLKLMSVFELIGKHASNQITGKKGEASLVLLRFFIDEAMSTQLAIAWFWVVGYVATLIPKIITSVSVGIISTIELIGKSLAQLKRITQIDFLEALKNNINNSIVLNMASPNLFGKIVSGDYIFGIYSVIEEPSKKFLQYKTHNYFFMIGPNETSLEFAFYIPWNGVIKI